MIMEEKNTFQKDMNKVHLNGVIIDVKMFNLGKLTKAIVKVSTAESFKNAEGEAQKKYSYNSVRLVTDNEKLISSLKDIADDIEERKKNAENPDFEATYHTVAVDGALVVSKNEGKDGKTYYNPEIAVKEENFHLNKKLEENESRNRGEFQGNVVKIDFPSKEHDFAIVRIATHYSYPLKDGKTTTDYKGKETSYKEETSFIETRINKSRLPETYEKLENGDIKVGDKISVRGQLHNNNYTSNETYRSEILVDLNKVDLIFSATQKEEKAEEKKEEKKTEKKATSRKKKQVTL